MKTEKQGWMPKEIFVCASEATGKMFGHLGAAKNRTKYIRADLAQAPRVEEVTYDGIIDGITNGAFVGRAEAVYVIDLLLEHYPEGIKITTGEGEKR